MRSVSLTLPWPPSTNHLWRSPNRGRLSGRVLLSSAGRTYQKLVGQLVLEQGIPRNTLSGRLSVTILAYPPDRRRRDLDNFKVALDSLSHAGVIRDDGDIDDLLISRRSVTKGGRLIVSVRELT